MNFPKPFKFRHWTVFVATLSAFVLSGCDQTKTTQGGSGDETSTLAFYHANGAPAAKARVSIYGSSDTGVEPRTRVVTDANGRTRLPVQPKGFYNLVVRDDNGNAVFQDSLYSDGTTISAASDTLHATGILIGRLKVQPQHSPRIAWIQILGAGIWMNVDDSGRFRIEGVPAGKLTLAALTREDGYTPTFARVKTISDSTVDAGTIELIYTGLPVVKNLQARFDTLAGIVSLKWDSTALRQTWHYNVYRDDIQLGQTTGSRWIDTVSDEYPGNVPGQGLHTYRVALASADSVGPKWESITMRIISAYLYQEVKIDWEKRADLPWKAKAFSIDTVGGMLVGWSSSEYLSALGATVGGISSFSLHRGWIEEWVSGDSGRSWNKIQDSLPLGAFPVRHGNLWWSVQRGVDAGDDKFWLSPARGLRYQGVLPVVSSDGIHWDSLPRLAILPKAATNWRFERVDTSLILVGNCEGARCEESDYSPHDIVAWKVEGSRFDALDKMDTLWPRRDSPDMERKRFWSDGWWQFTLGDTTGGFIGYLNQKLVPVERNHIESTELENSIFCFKVEQKIIFFGYSVAFSTEAITMSLFHSIGWPGTGRHFEMKYGDGILSVSDAGVYIGRILSGTDGGDPRGTWVKQTEIPAVF